MHIHLPKPLHGWRAFLGEVGVIVLGVLIALACEQLVDELRWREKIDRAEASMRLELSQDDGPQAYGRLLVGRCLDQAITRIHDGAGTVPADQLRRWTADYRPPFRLWDSEAWKVVVASDTGSHMGSDRLIAWSSPYRMLPATSESSAQEGQRVVALRETLPPTGDPTAAELQDLRREAGQLRLLNHRQMVASELLLSRIASVGAPVPVETRRALLAQARPLYGDCVVAPDLNARPSAGALRSDLTAD